MIRFMGYSNAKQDTRRRRGQTLLAQTDTVALFNVSLKQGQTMLRGTFLDDQGKEICGAYYVSVRRLD